MSEPTWSVRSSGGNFELWGEDGLAARITSALQLDPSSAHFRFDVLPLVSVELKENRVLEVFLRRQDSKRVGWLIPANALSSDQHDFTQNTHFLKYAYVAIANVLESHQGLFTESLAANLQRGEPEIPFSDLFHDNVSFLVVCLDLINVEVDFELARLVPSLVSVGYVPMSHCDPSEVTWVGKALDDGVRALKIRPTSSSVTRVDLPAKLFAVAASSGTSSVTQFFYLYQVVELLMEEILLSSLWEVGLSVKEAIYSGQHLSLKDHLENLSGKLSEKGRLSVLMQSFQGGPNVANDLFAASTRFLMAVGVEPKDGFECLYQVRNFIIHQVRHMPDRADEILADIVPELATFLATVLGTFYVAKRASAVELLNSEYETLSSRSSPGS